MQTRANMATTQQFRSPGDICKSQLTHMKKYNIVLLTVLIGCSSFSQTKTFKNDRYNYSFSYPNDWALEDKKVYADIIAPDDHPEERGRERISISTDTTSGMTLEQCYKTYVTEWYREQFEGVIKAEGSTTLNGRKAKWMEYQFERGGVSMTYLIYFIFCDDRFFLIDAVALTKRYPSYKRKFEAVINSFTVR